MKIAVSIPDTLFEQADRYAKAAAKSSSQVYAEALRDYLARHTADEITGAMNSVIEELGDEKVPRATQAAAIHILRQVEW